MNKIKHALTLASEVSLGTWVRLAMLLLAMINMAHMVCGIEILHIESEQLSQAVSILFAFVTALTAYWKNNSFTRAALAADRVLRGEAEIKEKETPNEN